MQEIELPSEASVDKDAVEFLRAWHSGTDIGFVSRGNIFADAGYIGIFLADLLRHIVSSSEESNENKEQHLLRAIAAFGAEFSELTS